MDTKLFAGLAVVLATVTTLQLQAQTGGYAVAERGPDWKVLQKTTVENGVTNVHRYTELATGMNYTNATGQLVESKEQITLLPGGGAMANQGRHTVAFPGDIGAGVLEVVTPDGKHLYSRPLGVTYDDGSNTVFIATLTNAVGYLTRSNQVTYRDCFSGIKADLVCTWRRGGFECDLVFREQPPTPGDYGLDEDWSTLQMVTEFFNTPDPQQIPGANDDWFGLQDSTLKFGKLTMKQGRAFAFNGSNTNSHLPSPNSQTPVYKRWVKFDGRKFLIEEVPVIDLAENLNALPLMAKASSQTPDAKSQALFATVKHVFPPARGISECTNQILLAAADFSKEPGVVLDYNIINTDQTNGVFIFAANTTYYISDTFDVTWGVVINGGAVLKFAPGAMMKILSCDFNPIVCQTTAENPAVLTSKDDDTAGETIVGSTGEPVMDYAHLDFEVGPAELKHLHINYGGVQAVFNGSPGSMVTLDDVQIHHAGYGVSMYGGSLIARNLLLHDLQVAFFLESVPAGVEHLTLDQCSWFYGFESDGQTMGLTNSLLVNAGDLSWAPLATNSVVILNNSTGVFSADYHLATNSPYRDMGTTSINPAVQTELQITTTYPPGDWLNHCYAPPDNDGLPDLGYHYPLENDEDRDGLADVWELVYFKTLVFGPATLDTNGNPLVYDYTNNLVPVVPNDIEFIIAMTNQYVRTSLQTLPIHVAAGVPVYYAVQVDKTNYQTSVSWNFFTTTNLTASLGSTQGWHDVWVGLKGGQSNDVAAWQWIRLKLDTSAPVLIVTNPAIDTVDRPVIQLQGWVNEAVQSLSYDITNSIGLMTNQSVMITGQVYDTNTFEFTTNCFHAYDMPLTNGLNVITLHAKDKAGNVTTTNFSFTLDYTGKSTPAVALLWPNDGLEICGSNIVCRGWVSDDTATVTVQLVNSNGETNTVDSLVGRDGIFYADNLTLAAGTNYLSYMVRDVAGNETHTNIAVLTSDFELTLEPVAAGQSLVYGTIGDTNYTICVNGVQATNNGDHTWSAEITPIGIGGGAVVVNAVLGGGDPSLQQIVQPPEGVFVSQYHFDWHYEIAGLYDTGFTNPSVWDGNMHWEDGKGGTKIMDTWFAGGDYDLADWLWPATAWPMPLSNGVETLKFGNANGGPFVFTYDWGTPDFAYEHWDETTPVIVGAEDRNWQRRTADTEVKLATGGPPGSRELNLWCISASATAYTNAFDTVGTNVPFDQIQIGNLGRLETNGELWVLLPDNDPDDVTPVVLGMSLLRFTKTSAQKYKPTITANGAELASDSVTSAADFCVGQAINFNITGLPRSAHDIRVLWNLPGTFVNTNSDPNCDLYYEKNFAILRPPQDITSTRCWYVKNDKPLTASVDVYFRCIQNGALIHLTITGKFNIQRPTTGKGSPYPDGTPTARILGGSLSLGDKACHNDMSFSHTINPGYFAGHAGYTQIITHGDITTYPLPTKDLTGTIIWSDQNGLGKFGRGEPEVPANTATTVKFWDAPDVSLALNETDTSEDLYFKNYLMFKPDAGPGPNIYVPLRLITWELHDVASHSTGAWVANSSHNGESTEIKSDIESKDFPHWTNVW